MSRTRPGASGLGRVAVLGLGQIGGSLAWRLRQRKCAFVVGCDHDPAVLRRARGLKVAHAFTADVGKALQGADIVILALPVASIVAALLDPHVPWESGSLVIDVGSTKRLILEAADRRLPPMRFVGTHPMAGSEKAGLAGARPDLFTGAAFALVRGRHATSSDLRRARRLVKVLGGRAFEMDAITHDHITALTIGLPHVLALLLRNAWEAERKADPRVSLLSGSSLKSALRVSYSDAVMVSDLIESNCDFIEAWWHRVLGEQSPSRKKGRPRRGPKPQLP